MLCLKNFLLQLSSAAEVLKMTAAPTENGTDLKKQLLSLPRIGEETAMTLMVYLFGKKGVIVDEYLERILSRHGLLDRAPATRSQIRRLLENHVRTPDESRRFHARIDEMGVLFCFAHNPDCKRCPLDNF